MSLCQHGGIEDMAAMAGGCAFARILPDPMLPVGNTVSRRLPMATSSAAY